MLKKQLIISVLATFFILGLLGTAFASGNSDVYDGSEAGNWEHNFNAPETKADIAARNHVYSQEQLATFDHEAGDWEFTFESTAEAVAGESNNKGAVCSNC